MGSSYVYAVYSGTDLWDVYRRAKRLSGLLEALDDTVDIQAELRTLHEARRMMELLPDAACWVDGPCDDERTVPSFGDHERESLLPFRVAQYVPRGSVEEAFLGLLGTEPASVSWKGTWPDDPALDACGWAAYDGVEAVFNSADRELEVPAGTHTVHAHVGKYGDPDRARWLAEQIGGSVLSESRYGR